MFQAEKAAPVNICCGQHTFKVDKMLNQTLKKSWFNFDAHALELTKNTMDKKLSGIWTKIFESLVDCSTTECQLESSDWYINLIPN